MFSLGGRFDGEDKADDLPARSRLKQYVAVATVVAEFVASVEIVPGPDDGDSAFDVDDGRPDALQEGLRRLFHRLHEMFNTLLLYDDVAGRWRAPCELSSRLIDFSDRLDVARPHCVEK